MTDSQAEFATNNEKYTKMWYIYIYTRALARDKFFGHQVSCATRFGNHHTWGNTLRFMVQKLSF